MIRLTIHITRPLLFYTQLISWNFDSSRLTIEFISFVKTLKYKHLERDLFKFIRLHILQIIFIHFKLYGKLALLLSYNSYNYDSAI